MKSASPVRAILAAVIMLTLGACAEETGGRGSSGAANPPPPAGGEPSGGGPAPGSPAGEPGDTGGTDTAAPFERSVAYISSEDDGDEQKLYAIDIDGQNLVELSGNPQRNGKVSSVVLSPDGRWAAYVAEHDRAKALDLYVTNRDGSIRQKLSSDIKRNSAVRSVTWSPDSSQLAYIISSSDSKKKDELWLVSADGSSNRRVVWDNESEFLSGSGYSWSASGRFLGISVKRGYGMTYFSVSAIGEMQAVSVGIGNLFSNSWGAWSADEDRFAYISSVPFRAPVLTSYEADRGVRSEVVNTLNIGDGILALRWSPDSRYIASFAPSKGGIFVAPVSGGANTQVSAEDSTGLSSARNFVWAPDNASVAMVAIEDRQYQLLLARADGSSTITYPLVDPGTKVRASSAVFSPNSQYLAYIDGRDQGRLYISDGGGFGTRQTLASADRPFGSLYWARDGSGLLYEAETSGDSKRALRFVSLDGQQDSVVSTNLSDDDDEVLCIAVMPNGIARDQQNGCQLFSN
ncbi:hypothetical protein [Allohahella marinimesophila]|uniref:WD40 repeat protein n=1 Tax=Allohahella marinimesophila TaxID=1054972 RepID=A0ABP7NX33_9GAMM